MSPRVIRSRYGVVALIFMIGLMIWISMQMWQPRHVYDIGISVTRGLTDTMRGAEKAVIDNQLTTFRWAYQESYIWLPTPFSQSIVKLRLMTRAESAPSRISFNEGNHTYSINPRPGLRTYHVFTSLIQPIQINCDIVDTSNDELAHLCVAVDWVKLDRTSISHLHLPVLAWYVLLILITSAAIRIVTHTPTYWLMAITIVMCWIAQFAQTLSYFLPHACLIIGGFTLMLWGSSKITTPWKRIACQLFLICCAIKTIGTLTPDFMGSDTFFHMNKLTHALKGSVFQTTFGGDGDRNLRTFPYPPSAYISIAPWMLPVMQWYHYQPYQYVFGSTLTRFIELYAVLIDSSMILIISWILAHMRWSATAIGWSALMFMAFPASYIMLWQGSFAQNIAQWYGLLAMATAVIGSVYPSWIFMALSMTTHFGVFLTLLVTYSVAWCWRVLHPIVRHWYVILGIVGIVYYSQFTTLIMSQISSMSQEQTSSTFAVRWWDYAWEQGIYGHYVGIGIALTIIGLWYAPHTRWWFLSLSMFIGSVCLCVMHVILDKNTSRYMIAILPVVAVYASIALLHISKSRAGRIVAHTLTSYLIWYSGTAWFSGTILGNKMHILW